MDPAGSWPLFVLAADHRVTLRNMYNLPDPLEASDQERLEDVKHLTLDALVEAAPRLAAGVPGLLVDEEYGAAVALRARQLGMCVAMPVEKSLQPMFELEYGEDFKAHIERFAPDYVKALVSYNPAGDGELNAVQRERLVELDAALRQDGRAFMLEVLVPPTDEQLAAVEGNPARFDDEIRPELVSAAIAELREAGIAPTLWKLEGTPGREGAEQIVETVSANGSSAQGCLILGRGQDEAKVIRWLEVAASVNGFVGFAVGRTIWSQPVDDYLNNRLNRAGAIAAIRDNYLRLVGVYLDNRANGEGTRAPG